MTTADIEARLRKVEHELEETRREAAAFTTACLETIAELRRQQVVISTGVALARWFGPFFVSVAAVVIVLVRG